MKINVRSSTGQTYMVEADKSDTVEALKLKIADATEAAGQRVEATIQRLVYLGRVLKDAQTVEECGIEDSHTVHMVKSGKAAAPAPQPATAAVLATPMPTAASVAPRQPAAPQRPPQPAVPFTPASPFGMGLPPNVEQMYNQMAQNPEMMREVMNSPMMDMLLQNPELMRQAWSNDPQMQAILQQHPELNEVLNDPETMRNSIEAMRNPAYQTEMLRNMDRTMAHIENMPGGLGMLNNARQGIQDPMIEAASSRITGGAQERPDPALAQQLREQEQNRNRDNPNSMHLPNPWAPATRPTAPVIPARSAQPAAPFGGPFGSPFGGGGDMGGFDPMAMMQDPMVRSMMESIANDPAAFNAMVSDNPMFSQMAQNNPAMNMMAQNPEMMRQMLLAQLRSFDHTASNPPNPQQGSHTAPSRPAWPGMFGSPGASPMMPPPARAAYAAPESNEQLRVRYARQLEQLHEMGFMDDDRNVEALRQCLGDVGRSIERLLM